VNGAQNALVHRFAVAFVTAYGLDMIDLQRIDMYMLGKHDALRHKYRSKTDH
jgi:hypothetical protein